MGLIVVVTPYAGIPSRAIGDKIMVIGSIYATQCCCKSVFFVVQTFGYDAPLKA
jgi:hypothetical protein